MLPLDSEELPDASIVPRIKGMSSTGLETSGRVPVATHLGTPRDDKSRSPPREAVKDVDTPQWSQLVVASHRGMGSVPPMPTQIRPSPEIVAISGGNAVGSSGRSHSERGRCPPSYGQVSKRSLTPRTRTPPPTVAVAAPAVESEVDEILRLRTMMFKADKAYSKMILDAQQVFA